MADKVVSLEFNVNTDKAVSEINQVTKATEGAEKATVNYNEEIAKIKKSTDGAGIKDLNKALKDYQNIALQAGENSPIGRQALTEAGELKDRLLDLKTAIRTTGQDGLQLQAALQLGGGIVAGFGAVQGVMALVGSESEDLQKTLVKLQAVQATLASVEEIRSVLEKESALRIMAVTVAEKARAAATVISTFVTNGSTLALKAFRVALIGTGIGAIVVLLIAAADAMGLFGESADTTALQIDKLNKATEKEQELLNKSNEAIDERLKRDILRAKIAGKTEGDIVQIEKDAQNEKIKNLIKYNNESNAAFDKISANKNATNEQINEARKRSEESWAELLKAQNERNIKSLEYDLDAEEKKRELEQETAEKAASLRKIKQEKEKAAAEEAKRIAAEKLAQEKADAEEAIRIADEQYLELQRIKNTAKEQEILELTLEYEKKYELAKGNAELENALLEEQNLKALEIGDKYRAVDEENKQKKKEADKLAADQQIAEDIRIRDAKIQIANDLQSTLTSLGSLLIKDSAKAVKFNKSMALIQIGIDTAVALTKALNTTQSPSPDNVATGGLAGVAKYAGIAAMIFANAAKAKQILSSGGGASGAAPTGGGGGGGGGIPAQMQMQQGAPSIPGQTSTILKQQTPIVKAVVIESDITGTQKRINSIKENASI